MFTNARVKQLRFSASLVRLCFPREQLCQQNVAASFSLPFQRCPVFNSSASCSGKCCIPASCQHQPLLISPWDPDSNTLVLHFAQFLVLILQRTDPSQAPADGVIPQGIPCLSSHTHLLSPVPHVHTCPHTYSMVLQTLQPWQLRSIFSAWELLQGSDIFYQQLQTGQQSSINMGEVQAALLAAL